MVTENSPEVSHGKDHPLCRGDNSLSTYPENGFLYRLVKPFRNVYIRKMPNVVSGMGAFSAAEMPRASTCLVSSGSMIPSSQSRAVE